MDSTGSTPSIKGDADKTKNMIPQDKWKFIPSIREQGLDDNKSNKKKLEGLFQSYLKP